MIETQIVPVRAFKDNYIWLIINPDNQMAVCIDPGDAGPVIKYLQDNDLSLSAILITHHHWDHTNGIGRLLRLYPAPLYGPANETVHGMTNPVSEGDVVEIPDSKLKLKVLDVPGHTSGHIAYHNTKTLFCGDTLFTAGCGRIFEGSTEQMYGSLQKLAALKDDVQVYCAHEYTETNLRFAETVEPMNKDIKARMEAVRELRKQGQPSVPATIAEEKKTNPFFRCEVASVKAAAEQYQGKPAATAVEVFGAIRDWKNHFA